MDPSIYQNHRTKLVDWVKSQLVGPAQLGTDGDGILMGEQPIHRYPCGLLFPTVKGGEGFDAVSDEVVETDSDEEDLEESSIKKRYVPPSSVGFSFFIQGSGISFSLDVSAARYDAETRDEKGQFSRQEWHRVPLKLSDSEQDILNFRAPNIEPGHSSQTKRERLSIFSQNGEEGNRAGIDLLWRKTGQGWLVTVTLFNAKELPNDLEDREYAEKQNEHTLFEVALNCQIHSGTVGDYPRVDPSLLSEEERELELQYQSRNIYAIGHGAAADWKEKGNHVTHIWSDFIPTVEVPTVTTEIKGGDKEVLQMRFLAQIGTSKNNTDETIAKLTSFVDGYEHWVDKEYLAVNNSSDKESAKKIHQRMKTAVERMRQSLTVLSENELAADAFAMANGAMADQMQQVDSIRGISTEPHGWRPFQLAFLLTAIESTVNEDSDYRDIVDLIWFPTGGGKTEAYLGLIAFLIIWRRLKFPQKGGGTTALMRYTLSLLTSQQFERATRLICALELMRRQNPRLGKEPISIGIWVGRATSPNTYKDALDTITQTLKEDKPTAPSWFVIRRCPWCSSNFAPDTNYSVKHASFKFLCKNDKCAYAASQDSAIPCRVVDQDLYDNPPTLLIATIDKFARLAWEDRANAFFGKNGNRPPELIIQDELHLIASALGSIAGLYEAAVDTIIESRGVYPKVIASTATIRMAEEQVRKLYGKDLAVFPPPGFSCDDSYFAKTVPTSEKPGRLYVGYLAPMLGRNKCLAPLATALMAAPEAIFNEMGDDTNDLLEAWWSLIIYHGSIKGVGVSHNAIDIDVLGRLDKLKRELMKVSMSNRDESNSPPLNTNSITRKQLAVAQLTSQSSAEKNAQTFTQLEIPRGHSNCLDVALATNMISVGLDVSRLALMIINGQPLTTGEYIQSSSRVGRSSVPGLVFTNYYRDQTRSLSHYESFKAYHESFYRFVEPTSITPFTYQARFRALHAALVISIRHSLSTMLNNNSAGEFEPDDEQTLKVIETLKRQCKKRCWIKKKEGKHESMKLDPDLFNLMAQHLDNLVIEWSERVEKSNESKRSLVFSEQDNTRNSDRLLYNHHDKIPGLWPTLQSMRNVEASSLIKQL